MTSTWRPKTATLTTRRACAKTIHHTTQERDHFKALLALGLTDAFRMFEQPEKSFHGGITGCWAFKNRGLRIDHILVSEALRPKSPRAW